MNRIASVRPALARTSLALALCLAWQAPAFAADAAAAEADNEGGLTEIIVTAQKRSENLQDTPISISVMTAQSLADRRVVSLLDLGDGAIPSLKVAPFFSRPGALIVNVRGVGVLSDSNQPARDQGVGVYVDGVYMGRAQGLGAALFDVENIEVLKGPQGTLFGRNTEGGAVNIVTKKPSGQFKLNATAGMGNYGSYRGEVHLDLPEFSNISIKLDGVLAKRDPFVKNPLSGALGFNSYDKRGPMSPRCGSRAMPSAPSSLTIPRMMRRARSIYSSCPPPLASRCLPADHQRCWPTRRQPCSPSNRAALLSPPLACRSSPASARLKATGSGWS